MIDVKSPLKQFGKSYFEAVDFYNRFPYPRTPERLINNGIANEIADSIGTIAGNLTALVTWGYAPTVVYLLRE